VFHRKTTSKNMSIRKQPLNIRLLFSIGLLLVTVPTLIKNYAPIPDFFRGLLLGIGLALEIVGIVKMKQNQKAGSSC
jgi:hypothetical protein